MINSSRKMRFIKLPLVICAIFFLGGCGRSNALSANGGQLAVKEEKSSEYWRSVAKTAIKRNQLTSLAEGCVKLDVGGGSLNEPVEITVSEIHNDICGGDPNTEPRLFTLVVDRQTERVSSDVFSEDGEFLPLK